VAGNAVLRARPLTRLGGGSPSSCDLGQPLGLYGYWRGRVGGVGDVCWKADDCRHGRRRGLSFDCLRNRAPPQEPSASPAPPRPSWVVGPKRLSKPQTLRMRRTKADGERTVNDRDCRPSRSRAATMTPSVDALINLTSLKSSTRLKRSRAMARARVWHSAPSAEMSCSPPYPYHDGPPLAPRPGRG
jgi:hypothetical protein